MEPKPSRMTSPGYGFAGAKAPPGERFPWSRVEELLTKARNYWVCTTGPEGRPHAAPVWGLWLDGRFYFSTGEESRKARNIAANPYVTVHPETPDEAVMFEGAVGTLTGEEQLQPVWAAYKEKYDWEVEGYPFYIVRPSVAFSFKEDLAETATRWRFPGPADG